MKSRLTGLLFSCVLLATAASAQVFDSVSGHYNGDTVVVTIGPPRVFGLPVIKGSPFTADRVSDHTQTLADGTQIRRPSSIEHIFRDSRGRTRTERPAFGQSLVVSDHAPDFKMTVIVDTVASFAYLLDDQNKVAHRVHVVLPVGRPAVRGASSETVSTGAAVDTGFVASADGIAHSTVGARPRPVDQKLGVKNIEGVLAEGTRTTTTWTVGSLSNDRPVVMTNEVWRSIELEEIVASTSSSPFKGEDNMRLINLTRVEADPSLFQPPADYTVVDEKDSFRITIKRQ
jgi:hypothetical protein